MQTPALLNIKKRSIFEPPGGWVENTYYLCEVAFSPNNIIHRTVFYTGFLNGGVTRDQPGGYSGFVAVVGRGEIDINLLEDAFYLNPFLELMDDDLNPTLNPVSTGQPLYT